MNRRDAKRRRADLHAVVHDLGLIVGNLDGMHTAAALTLPDGLPTGHGSERVSGGDTVSDPTGGAVLGRQPTNDELARWDAGMRQVLAGVSQMWAAETALVAVTVPPAVPERTNMAACLFGCLVTVTPGDRIRSGLCESHRNRWRVWRLEHPHATVADFVLATRDRVEAEQ